MFCPITSSPCAPCAPREVLPMLAATPHGGVPLRLWQVTQRLSVVGVEMDARSCPSFGPPCGSWHTTQVMCSSSAEPFSTKLPVTPNFVVIAAFPSWQGAQEGLLPSATASPEPCADWIHWSTYGSWVPVWHAPHPLVPVVSALIDASGSFAAVGLCTCVNPAPWQLSHCTSW